MNIPTYIVTVVNEKTKQIKGFWFANYEDVDEFTLEPNEIMFVNQLGGEDCTKYD